MKFLIVMTAVLTLPLLGCSMGASNQRAEIIEEDLLDEREARAIAADYMARAQLGWGDPVKVHSKERKFLFGYLTPLKERRLLGPRTLIIDQKTRTVEVMKRR